MPTRSVASRQRACVSRRHRSRSRPAGTGSAGPTEAARRFVGRHWPADPPPGNLRGCWPLLAIWPRARLSCSRASRRFARGRGRGSPPAVAVMGEFNAGKSSFVNALCGAEIARVGVTPPRHHHVLRLARPADAYTFTTAASRNAATPKSEHSLPTWTALRRVPCAWSRPSTRCLCCKKSRSSTRLAPTRCGRARARGARVSRRGRCHVWIFSLTQAGKASERSVLDRAHAAGKRALACSTRRIKRVQTMSQPARAHRRDAGRPVEALVPLSRATRLRPSLLATTRA